MRAERARIDAEERASRNGEGAFTPFTPILKVEEFPVELLPDGCRGLVKEAASTIGCPTDFLAAPMFAVLGSAIGYSHVIEIVEGWTEAPNLWIATVGHPGTRKTPPAREAKRPVAGHQAKLRQEYRDALKAYEQEQREEPPSKHTDYVDDITTELLITTLDETPRGVIQFKDELLGLIRGLDQYKGGKGSDRQFYLSGWSGESYAYKRKGAQDDILLRPALAVVGSIQTDLLHEIADGREDGLTDRFLYVFPDKVRSRLSEEKRISEGARKSYATLYMRLRELDDAGEDEHGHRKPHVVRPTGDAKALLLELINGLRDEAELPGFPRRLTWVWPKLEAYLARLALILAMSRYATLKAAGQDVSRRVEKGDVMGAYQLLEYFKSHIRRTYAQLYGHDVKEQLIEDVARFLYDHGGTWKGTPTALHEELDSDYKPKRPDELSKRLLERARTRKDIIYDTSTERAVKQNGDVTTARIATLGLVPIETV